MATLLCEGQPVSAPNAGQARCLCGHGASEHLDERYGCNGRRGHPLDRCYCTMFRTPDPPKPDPVSAPVSDAAMDLAMQFVTHDRQCLGDVQMNAECRCRRRSRTIAAADAIRAALTAAEAKGREEERKECAEIARTHGLEHPGYCKGGPNCWHGIARRIEAKR